MTVSANLRVSAGSHGGAVATFCLLGVVCLSQGVGLVFTGMFVGPHLITAGLVGILIGVAGLVVAAGIAADARWARIAGIVLSSAVAAGLGFATTSRIIHGLRADELGGETLLGVALMVGFFAPFPAVAVSLLRAELAGARETVPDRSER